MTTAAAKPEPGQVAYEARLEGFTLGPRGVSDAWDKLGPEARAKWAWVEAAVLAARPLTPLGHLGGLSVNKAAHHAGGLDLAAHVLRAKEKLGSAKSCEDAATYLRALIEEAYASPVGLVDDGTDRCIACAAPLRTGERVLDDANGGVIHAACCGPERESYTGPDGEALGPNAPIPQGYAYEPAPMAEGWRMVPVEPTDGMQQDGLAALEAAIRAHGKPTLPGFAAAHVYRAMVAAAPAPAGAPTGGIETFETIAQWCEETFGPIDPARIVSRAAEEMEELRAEPTRVEEAADVVIVLSRYPGLWEAVERKMKVNRGRRWRLMGDGTGYHMKAEPAPPPAGEA